MKDLFDDSRPASKQELDQLAHQVMLAMALLWTERPRTDIYNLARKLGLKHPAGRAITSDEVKQVTRQLVTNKMAFEALPRQGYFRLENTQRIRLY